jgi:hypothetical protein
MSEVEQYGNFALLAASLIYFWTVMFERFSWSCSVIAGMILVGIAGRTLLPVAPLSIFDFLSTAGFAALLFGRSWLIWKEWRDAN